MSNGKIDAAKIDALMVGVPDDEAPRMRFILTTLTETKHGLDDMREVCEQRALVCPGLHLADPVEVREQEAAGRQTWVMWSVGRAVLERVALPVAVVLLTLGLTRLF